MYEFINANGERVSVRSARTLVTLLSEGSIKGDTRFRRAEESTYVAAATHAELGRIAKDAGIALVAPQRPVPPPPELPPLEIEAPEAILLTRADIPPAPAPRSLLNEPAPLSVENSPSTMQTVPARVQPRPLTATPTVPRPPPPSALALALQPHQAGWRVLVVVLHYFGMGAASIAAGTVVGGMSGSVAVGTLSAKAVFVAAGHVAGQMLVTQRGVPPGWEALLATALVCGVATAVGGVIGLILSVVAGAVLWRSLKATRAAT